MWRQCCRLEVWEDLSYSSQLFLSKGSGEFVLVGDVRLYVFLGAEFSRLVVGDELGVKLGSEDTLQGTEVVVVGVIRHERCMSGWRSSRKRDDGILARHSLSYMSSLGGP